MGRFFPTRQRQRTPSLGRIAKEQAIAASISGLAGIITSTVKDRFIDLPEANRQRGMEVLGLTSNLLGKSMEMAIHADNIDVTNPAEFLKRTEISQKTFEGAGTVYDPSKFAEKQSELAQTEYKETGIGRDAVKQGRRVLTEAQMKAQALDRANAGKIKSVRKQVSGYDLKDKEDLMRARRELSQAYRRAAISYSEMAQATWKWGAEQGYVAKEMQEGMAKKIHSIASMAETMRAQMQRQINKKDPYEDVKQPTGSSIPADRMQNFDTQLSKDDERSLLLLDEAVTGSIHMDGYKKGQLENRVLGQYQAAQASDEAKAMLSVGRTPRGLVVVNIEGDPKKISEAHKNGDLVIMPGMSGGLVRDFQVLLNQNYGANIRVDGIYGRETLKAVRSKLYTSSGKITPGLWQKAGGTFEGQETEAPQDPADDTAMTGELTPAQLEQIRSVKPVGMVAQGGRSAYDVPPRGRNTFDPRPPGPPVATDLEGYTVDDEGQRVGLGRGRIEKQQRIQATEKYIQDNVGSAGLEALKKEAPVEDLNVSASSIVRLDEEQPEIMENTVNFIQDEMSAVVLKHNQKAQALQDRKMGFIKEMSSLIAKNPAVKTGQSNIMRSPSEQRIALFMQYITSNPALSKMMLGAVNKNLKTEEKERLLDSFNETLAQQQATNRAAAAEYFVSVVGDKTFDPTAYGQDIEDLGLEGKKPDEIRAAIIEPNEEGEYVKISEALVGVNAAVFQAFFDSLSQNKELQQEFKDLREEKASSPWTRNEADKVYRVYMMGFDRGLRNGKMSAVIKSSGRENIAWEFLLDMRAAREKPFSGVTYSQYGDVSKRDFIDVSSDLAKYVVGSSKRFKEGGGALSDSDYQNIFQAGMRSGKTSSSNLYNFIRENQASQSKARKPRRKR